MSSFNKKIAFFITSYRQLEEIKLLGKCLQNCSELKNFDFYYFNNNPDFDIERAKSYIDDLPVQNKIFIHTRSNTGYVNGSINGIFENYELLLKYHCIVHIHADVFPVKEEGILNLLRDFCSSDSSFLMTYTGIKNNLEEETQSDFYIFKPTDIDRDFFSNDNSGLFLEKIIYKRLLQFNIKCDWIKRYDGGYTNFHTLDKIGFWHCHDLQDIYSFLG